MALAVGSRVLVYGGFTIAGTTTDAILAYDPGTGTVSRIGSLVVPVHDAAGTVLGGGALIVGGGNSVPVRAVQLVDSTGTARLVGQLPSARADLGAAAFGGSALVIGGAASGVLDREILVTVDGARFQVLGKLLAGVRYAAITEAGGQIYVIGGVGAAGDTEDIRVVDPVTGAVRLLGRLPAPLSHATALVLGGRILVVGGRTAGKPQDAIWQIDSETGAADLVGHLPEAVSDVAGAVIDETAYLIGGETTTQVATMVAIVLR